MYLIKSKRKQANSVIPVHGLLVLLRLGVFVGIVVRHLLDALRLGRFRVLTFAAAGLLLVLACGKR